MEVRVMKKKTLLICFMVFSFVIVASAGMMDAGEKYVAKIGDDGVQKVEMVGGSYYYKPDHVVVKKGIPVEIKIVKDSLIIPHNIIIEKMDGWEDIKETITRNEKVIRFTPSDTGTYDFYCDKKLLFLKSHKDKGMKGVIEVVD